MDKSDSENNLLEIFPAEIIEMIFKHFKHQELLKLCLVNKTWNEYLEVNMRLMEKTKIVICERFLEQRNRCRFRSNRKYQTMVVENVSLPRFLDIASCVQLKSLTLDFVTLSSSKFFEFLLKTCNESVEEISLTCVKIKNSNRDESSANKMDFKQLKILSVTKCDIQDVLSLFIGCTKLQAFKFLDRIFMTDFFDDYNWKGDLTLLKPTDIIINILKRQKDLKYLKCYKIGFHNDFKFPIDFPFQLEELKLCDHFCLHPRPDEPHVHGPINEFYAKFLRDQKMIMRCVLRCRYPGTLPRCNPSPLSLILQMPVLKTLCIDVRWIVSTNCLPNESIEVLEIPGAFQWHKRMNPILEKILHLTPNVKKISEIIFVTVSVAKLLAKRLKHLKKLYAYVYETDDIQKILSSAELIVKYGPEFEDDTVQLRRQLMMNRTLELDFY